MAIPPDPIEEVLPAASAAVMAEVTAVISEDPQKPFPKAERGMTSVPGDVAAQVVELKVSEKLFGDVQPGAKLKVVKPAGEYKLVVGNKGPFLLQRTKNGDPVILGRYGPDSYGRGAILDAAKRAGR